MASIYTKRINMLRLAGLLYVLSVYFLAGLFSGYLSPKLSWRWGIWLTLPWIVWIFFNIAGAGFKDGILGSMGWLVLYSFPLLPSCAGAFAGAAAARWKKINPIN